MSEEDQIRELTEAAFWSKVHRLRRDNPHEVTAEQVGAGTGGGGGGGGASLLQYHPFWHSANTSTISGLGTDIPKWQGGVLGPDGRIYGIPYHSESVLIIDPVAGTADTTTISGLGTGMPKWQGGVLGPDGRIYGIPFLSDSVLIISPGMPTMPIEPLLSPYLNKF